jgi:acetolactate synthase-1/2/3 large subunit
MRSKDNMRTAAQVLVDQLHIHGVQHVFCVPGESYLAVLDAFHDSPIAVTVCRQEGGAAMMAEAVGKATGRPGVCFVTRGPGAANASPGIHVARQDSTPLVMFVGQVARDMIEREAFQELDYRAVFGSGSMSKWATQIDDPARVPEIVSRAFHTAANGRPGPVVVSLPEDMLGERLVVDDAPAFTPVETSPGADEMGQFAALLGAARAPMLILGGSRWSQAACDAVARFAHRHALPVCTTFRRLHLFDALHPCYAGDLGIGPNPQLVERIKSADLVVLIGGRLGELPSQSYTLIDIPRPQMKFVHVHPGAEELGRVYSAHLPIHATPTAFAAALERLDAAGAGGGQAAAAHADYLAWTEQPTAQPGAVNLGAVMVWLRENLPADAILCNGAGNYAAWIHRFFRFRRFGQHVAPTSGSMGYGVPAAVAMKRLFPARTVVCIAGDGDFLMNGQEFATAVQYDLPLIVVIADNGLYGTIRMHQEREFPGRVVATALRNPDFAAYARAFGGFGASVERTADFPAAFKEAQASGKPAIIRLAIDPDAITPSTTLSKIRAASLARQDAAS